MSLEYAPWSLLTRGEKGDSKVCVIFPIHSDPDVMVSEILSHHCFESRWQSVQEKCFHFMMTRLKFKSLWVVVTLSLSVDLTCYPCTLLGLSKKSGYFDKIIQSKCSISGSSTKLFSRSNGMEFIRWVCSFFYSEIVFLSNLKDIILWHENDNCIYARILCLRKTTEIITNLLWIFCVFFAKNRYRQNAKNGGSFF